jgi:hypothetical protein
LPSIVNLAEVASSDASLPSKIILTIDRISKISTVPSSCCRLQ